MIIHAALTVSSEENARQVFETLFEMPLLYTFEIPGETMGVLFGSERETSARVYATGNSRIEVFVIESPPEPGRFQHICLGFTDRTSVISRAVSMGFKTRKFLRDDAEVVFIVDNDGNLFEIKNV